MAILLNANNEYVDIALNSKWNWTPVSQVRTLSFYWRSSSLPNVDGEYQVLFILNDTDGNKVQFLFFRNGGALILGCTVHNSSWTNIGAFYTPWSPSVNTWYHITFVASSNGNCKIYVDGTAQSVTHSSWDDTTAITVDTYPIISNGVNISDDFQIAHFAWFDDELTSTEVGNIRNAPYSFDSNANILCSIHFDEGTGTTANDVQTVATQTDGTLINAITWTASPILGKSLSDSVNVSENVTRSLPLIISLSDNINVSENAQPQVVTPVPGALTKDVSDTIAVSDNVSPLIPVLIKSLFDAINISENVNPFVPALAKVLSDLINTSESADPYKCYAFPENGVIDNFDRADANDLGANWSPGYGSLLGVFGISSNQCDIYSQVASYTQAYYNAETYGPNCENFVTVSSWAGGVHRVALGIKIINPDSSAEDATGMFGYTCTFYGPSHATANGCQLKYVENGGSHNLGLWKAFQYNSADGDKYGVSYQDGYLYAWHCPVSTGEWYCVGREADTRYPDQVGYHYIYAHGSETGILLNDFGGGMLGRIECQKDDTISVSDNVTTLIPNLVKEVSDVIAISENVDPAVVSGAALTAEVANETTVSDAIAPSIALSLDTFDAIIASDNLSQALSVLTANLSDVIAVSENVEPSVSEVGALIKNIYDDVTVGDASEQLLPVLVMAVFDAIVTSDSLDKVIPVLYATLTDEVAVSEYLDAGAEAGKTFLQYNNGCLEIWIQGVKAACFTMDGVLIADSTKGVILTSPDNSQWRITVDNSGALSTTSV